MDEPENLLKALNYAYFYLKFRPRTKKELTDYLNKKAKRYKWPEGLVAQAISELEGLELIDDQKFIEWFVEQRSAVKPKAIFILKRRLIQFGVPKETIDEYFDRNKMDEVAMALVAIRFRWQQWKNLEKQERFKKVSGFLTRRGFRYDVVKKTIAKLEGKE